MKLEVIGGHFGYTEKHLLCDVNFTVEPGQVLAVLGPNGVGKTTMLRCMIGMLPWDRGDTYLDGTPLSSIPPKQVWRSLAYVPQAKASVFGFRALDMVLMGRSSHIGTFQQPREEDYRAAEEAMAEIGIAHLRDKLCTSMSGGELQMVLLARALATNPKLLILDEPESNLDFKNQLIILETVKRLAKEKGISSIMNTHFPLHALQIADLALMLYRDGTSVYGRPRDVLNESTMKKAYGVHVHLEDIVIGDQTYTSVIPLSVVP